MCVPAQMFMSIVFPDSIFRLDPSFPRHTSILVFCHNATVASTPPALRYQPLFTQTPPLPHSLTRSLVLFQIIQIISMNACRNRHEGSGKRRPRHILLHSPVIPRILRSRMHMERTMPNAPMCHATTAFYSSHLFSRQTTHEASKRPTNAFPRLLAHPSFSRQLAAAHSFPRRDRRRARGLFCAHCWLQVCMGCFWTHRSYPLLSCVCSAMQSTSAGILSCDRARQNPNANANATMHMPRADAT